MKVSMVVINYNDKQRVKRAIESCIEQTYDDIEIIVVDDGSDNETREIYKEYTDNIKLVQLERNDKTLRTPSRARNKGIDMATGAYICFLDSDNYYDKDFVKECMKYSADVMYVNWQIFGKQQYDARIETVWQPNQTILENYLYTTHLDHQCILVKKSVLDKVGKYDERLPRSQDCDMLVRLMMNTKKWVHIRKCLFYFEKHEEEQMKVIASFHGKMLWALKLGVAFDFLLARLRENPLLFFALVQGYIDFTTKPEWKEDYNKSSYKKLIDEFGKNLIKERSESGL